MKSKTTVRDIADKLGISPSTVSFVLNGVDKGISTKTRAQVITTASAMNYGKLPRSNLAGWKRVAFLSAKVEYFNFHTSFFAGVYSHLQRKSGAAKIELSLHEFNCDQPETAYLQLQKLRGQEVDVCICSDKNAARYLLKNGMKVILAQAGMLQECVSVFCDDYTAGTIAGEYALSMGHKIAGTIFPEKLLLYPRRSGFIRAFTDGGGCCPEEFNIKVDFQHELVIEQIDKAIKNRKLPSLFYCFADNLMFPAIRAFNANNLRVPDDVSLIGADNLYWGQYATPAFTTVDLNEEIFAQCLVEAVAHTLGNGKPYQLAVPVRLIERETVKKIN